MTFRLTLAFIVATALFVAGLTAAPRYEQGDSRIAFTEKGGIAEWQVAGKPVIAAGSAEPLVFLLDGKEGEGSGRFMVRNPAEEGGEKEGRTLTFDGTLVVGELQAADAKLIYRIAPDLRSVRVSIHLNWSDSVKEKRLRRLEWQQPLALNPRKRTFFQGDHGLPWETRYFYQFHVASAGQLLAQPDRNEWRFFGLDQLGPDAFRLWKAESETTSPLLMQEGRKAAPWVEVFDEQKGVALFYPHLEDQGPKSLRVDAAGTARLRVELWPAFAGPLALSSPRATALVKDGWEFELLAFEDEPARLAARSERLTGFPAKPGIDPDRVLEEPEWVRATPLADKAREPRYVTGGHPMARGELQPGDPLYVRIGKRKIAVQHRPLAYWPDGSIKWVQITFPWESGQVPGKNASAPYLTLRDGSVIPYTVELSDSSAPPLPEGIKIGNAPDAITIDTGRMTVTFATGSRWLRSLSVEGRPQLDPERPATAYVRYARQWESAEPWLTPEGGSREEADLEVEELSLVEQGPLRAVVRMAGHLKGKNETTKVILWVALHHGRAELAFTHTTEFLLDDPRQTMLTGLGVTIPLAGGRDATRLEAGGFTTPRRKTGQLHLLQTTPLWSEALFADASAEHPAPLSLARKESGRGWLSVALPGGDSGGDRLVGALRDFREMAPSGLSFADGVLRFELWPEAAPPMDVRRYSNYPHRGQGESVGDAETWVTDHYYAKQPFAGTSRTREFALAFLPGTASPAAFAADLQSPPLLYAGWPRYLAAGVALEGEDGKGWPRVRATRERFARFWLYHRELHQWYGYWQYGDLRHLFRNGYGWVLAPDALAEALKSPEKKTDYRREGRIQDYLPPNDWAYDNGRWGWTNTEGLPGLFFQNLYLQTGNRSHFFAAEGLARIARDVVTRHSGDLLGFGTRHGVQHWSDGNHEERQTVALEYRLHHFLTGEPRSREVISKLYEHRYSKAPLRIHAAHSGRLAGLLFHWEISGSQEEGRQFEQYVGAFLSPEGIYEQPEVRFEGGVSTGEQGGLNEGSMFFHTFGAMHSLLEYDRIVEGKNAALRHSLIAQAKAFLADPDRMKNHRWITFHGGVIGFAARYAADAAVIREQLRSMVLAGDWVLLYQPLTETPRHWSGPSAYLDRNVPGSLFGFGTLGWLAGGIGGEEPWSPDIGQAFAEREQNGAPPRNVGLSWQSEYDDRPEFDAYLGRQLPWRESSPGELP